MNHNQHSKFTCLLCPRCKRDKLIRKVLVYQWKCNSCSETFGPPWSTANWGERPGVLVVGAEPITERESEISVLAQTLDSLKPRRPGIRQLVVTALRVLISIALAASSLIAQLQLLQHNHYRLW